MIDPVAGQDAGYPLMAIDMTTFLAATAGTYTATEFNYQFSNTQPFGNTFEAGGTVQPIVLSGNPGTVPSDLTIVAVGDTVTYFGPTAFTTTPFGGDDTFTLSGSTNLYGGFYWTAPSRFDGPIGYENSTNPSQYTPVFYNGAVAPVVGGHPNSTSASNTTRAYDFSIEVDSTPSPTPLPSSLVMLGSGVVCLFSRRVRGMLAARLHG